MNIIQKIFRRKPPVDYGLWDVRNPNPVYLPPPFKFATKKELRTMIANGEIVPCNGIHVNQKQQVDYFVIVVSKKKLIELTMGYSCDGETH